MAEYDPSNPYMEKVSSLLAAAAGTHLAQNLATRQLYKSPRAAKKLANSFSEGYHGVSDQTVSGKASRALTGALVPDYAIMNKGMHDLGKTLKPHLDQLSKRERVGLRMATEGRYEDLFRRGLHKSPKIKSVLEQASKSTKLSIPDLSEMTADTARRLQSTWTSEKNPLLSNVAKNLSRGKPSAKATPGSASSGNAIMGSLAMSALEPAGGSLSLAKNLASTKAVRQGKYTKGLVDRVEKELISKPAKKGWENPGNDYVRGLGNRVMEYGVSPSSAQIKRTSSALSEAMRKPKSP